MKRFQPLITALVSILIFTSVVYAQPCKQKGITGTAQGNKICAPWINLTDVQQTQISALHNTFNNKTTILQKKLYKKRLKMKTMLMIALTRYIKKFR